MRYLIIALLLSFNISSCNFVSNSKSEISKSDLKSQVSSVNSFNEVKYIKSIKLKSSLAHSTFRQNDKVPVEIIHRRANLEIDSVQIFVDNKYKTTITSKPLQCILRFTTGKVGMRLIKAIAFHKNNKRGLAVAPVTILPNKSPIKRSFSIIKTYKHDVNFFTQGLLFHNGFIYEGTGQYGESGIKKIDLKNNEVISTLDISDNLFGEGIAIVGDKLIQLTWQSFKGFVYNLNSFSKESEFSYSTEGWGLTTMNDELVMSDGTNYLYFLDPVSFNIKSKIAVYNNIGEVDSLNELEYIDGLIYANIWQKDIIVIIDPKTGIVKEEIDLSSLLSKDERSRLKANDDVLNGIAYDIDNKRLFVTGKCWPKMFHIELK